MKFENSKMRISMLAVLIIIAGSLGLYSYANRGATTQSGETYLFIKPAFAQSMSTTPTFLDTEAGISAYVNINRSIDLAVARTANWSGLEKETSDYIVGSLHLPNLTENEDVHCFVHKEGWIVTYYGQDEPVSKIVDWNLWEKSTSKLTKSKLQVGLEKITSALGVPVPSVSYYHFQYPNANKCMMILETQAGSGEDSFNVTIPNDINVSEQSWSHYSERLWDSGTGFAYGKTDFKVNGITINTISGITGVSDPVTNRGIFIVWPEKLQQGASNIVSVSSNYQYGAPRLYGVCVALVYQEP